MERVSDSSVRLRQEPTSLKKVEAEIAFTAVGPDDVMNEYEVLVAEI